MKKPVPSAQVVGAFGERVVEGELLRRGWMAYNTNASIKNAEGHDIIALKGDRIVKIRVKTCGPGQRAFQFSFRPNQGITSEAIGISDFTILVCMENERLKDDFYIVPTSIVRNRLAAHKAYYLSEPKGDNTPKKDTGHWTLRLAGLKNGHEKPGYGLERHWKAHRNAWGSLLA